METTGTVNPSTNSKTSLRVLNTTDGFNHSFSARPSANDTFQSTRLQANSTSTATNVTSATVTEETTTDYQSTQRSLTNSGRFNLDSFAPFNGRIADVTLWRSLLNAHDLDPYPQIIPAYRDVVVQGSKVSQHSKYPIELKEIELTDVEGNINLQDALVIMYLRTLEVLEQLSKNPSTTY